MKCISGYTTNELEFVSTGLCPNCPECLDLYGLDSMEEFNAAVNNQDILDEGSFSWNPCDDCNTSLGGNSFIAHGRDSNGDLIHFKVCLDCFWDINS